MHSTQLRIARLGGVHSVFELPHDFHILGPKMEAIACNIITRGMPKRKPQIDGWFPSVLHISPQEKHLELKKKQVTTGLFVSCYYAFQAGYCKSAVRCYHVLLPQVVFKNGKHKLTEGFYNYCT